MDHSASDQIVFKNAFVDRRSTVDYRCEERGFQVFANYVAISNHTSLSSSETGINP
jgi:hypothetical protein